MIARQSGQAHFFFLALNFLNSSKIPLFTEAWQSLYNSMFFCSSMNCCFIRFLRLAILLNFWYKYLYIFSIAQVWAMQKKMATQTRLIWKEGTKRWSICPLNTNDRMLQKKKQATTPARRVRQPSHVCVLNLMASSKFATKMQTPYTCMPVTQKPIAFPSDCMVSGQFKQQRTVQKMIRACQRAQKIHYMKRVLEKHSLRMPMPQRLGFSKQYCDFESANFVALL